MPDPKLALKTQSIVVVTGRSLDDVEIIQEVKMTHDPAAPEASLIGHAFSQILQMGGIMVDEPGSTMRYYPWAHLKAGIHFAVKRVQLAQSSLLV